MNNGAAPALPASMPGKRPPDEKVCRPFLIAIETMHQKKICQVCGAEKPVSSFHKLTRGIFGVRGTCNTCTAAKKQVYIEQCWPKAVAKNAVKTAITVGKLSPKPCEVCGAAKADAHHDDYAKKLEVRWLCRLHHNQWHALHGESPNGVGLRPPPREGSYTFIGNCEYCGKEFSGHLVNMEKPLTRFCSKSCGALNRRAVERLTKGRPPAPPSRPVEASPEIAAE
jgi:hypothetical protein